MANATKAYAKATSFNVKFLIEENEHMPKELQAARQREEQSKGSSKAEMRKAILAKVSSLEIATRRLYDRFIIVHKEVVHLHGHHQLHQDSTSTHKYTCHSLSYTHMDNEVKGSLTSLVLVSVSSDFHQ